MCIIAHGLRKDFPEDEFKECLKTNPAGFFLAAIRAHDGTRTVAEAIRTLDSEEAVKKFEELQPEDEVVLHARIPSRGGKNIENVHGWKSEEGVYFCHNGTMSSIRAWDDHTDSETFFRKFFLPCWRGEGRQFTENVEFLIQQFLGYSKFCFILPDGTVKLYGEYQKDHNMEYSNGSYKVYVPVVQTPASQYSVGFRRDWDEDSTWWDNDGDDLYGYYGRANDARRGMTVAAPKPAAKDVPNTAPAKEAKPKPKPARQPQKPTRSANDLDKLLVETARLTTPEDDLCASPELAAKALRGFLEHYVLANYLGNFAYVANVDGKPMDNDLADAVEGLLDGLLDGTWLEDDYVTQANGLLDVLAVFADELQKGQTPANAAASLLHEYTDWLEGQFPEYRFQERVSELRVAIEAVERLLGIGVGLDTGYLTGTTVRPCASRYNRKATWTRADAVDVDLMIAPAGAKPAEAHAVATVLNKLGALIVELEKERK